MSWRSGLSGVSWDTGLSVVTSGASQTGPSFLPAGSSLSGRSWGAHWSRSSSDSSHNRDVSRLSFLTLRDFSTTEVALSSSSGVPGVGLADGTALSVGDHGPLAADHLVTLDLIAQHLSVITHADTTRLRLPDVPVGVLLTVRYALLILVHSILTSHHQNVQPQEKKKRKKKKEPESPRAHA